MLIHPEIDPIAFTLGPIAVRWYGLMYLVAFAAFFLLGRARLAKPQFAQASGLAQRELEDLLFWGAIGVVLGGRLGYVLFYKPGYYVAHPLEVFAVWHGGMSFHGGLIGVIAAVWLYCQRRGRSFWPVIDFCAPLVPIGLAAGRLGNFINGELWGRPTDLPWAMVFPRVDSLGRHPSQLYEFAGEGLALFALLWWFSARPRPAGAVSGLFLAGYAVLRFLAEFAREPDAFLGVLSLGLTMGQWLCLPMFAAGLALLVWAYRRRPADSRRAADPQQPAGPRGRA
ncbi:MAG: prolipoprotein diacylglyceryl transferase [Burkholderiales bacterium]|nr:prolipoprotein diacylglyceryl transferase [Burkholderiales bacterium]OJX04438.1 MAG: prolipoprotein diacylglyceryl transferase [Burkholderiales bacterium 70-64]